MKKVTAVLPARNCRQQLRRCLEALDRGEYVPEIIVVDDGSDDGTGEMVRRHWPRAVVLTIPAHTGYAHAANAGLRLVRTRYAMLIRPDLQPGRKCAARLMEALEEDSSVFCAVPRFKRDRDGAKVPNAPKVPKAPGRVGPPEKTGKNAVRIAGAPDGCAMYRMAALEEIGWLDERHFDGLEAYDLSLRGSLYGHDTVLVPGAAVRPVPLSPETEEAGAGKSGSTFSRQLAAGNRIYMMYKNLPTAFRLLELPIAAAGNAASAAGFIRRGELDAFRMAVTRGRALCSLEKERRDALESGTGIWPENLSDASFLAMEESAAAIYPLFLAQREPFMPERIPQYLRLLRMMRKDFRRLFVQ